MLGALGEAYLKKNWLVDKKERESNLETQPRLNNQSNA